MVITRSMTRASAAASAAYFDRQRLALAEMVEAAEILMSMKNELRRSARIAAQRR
jgi:hypothetical protein